MELVTRGMLNKQVGYALSLSEITVKVHRGSAMRKMAAGSIAELVRMADLLFLVVVGGYVLALLLVRRRVLRVEGHEKDTQGREVIVLHCGRNEAQYRVAEVMPTPERAAAIQQQLSELLQTHGS